MKVEKISHDYGSRFQLSSSHYSHKNKNRKFVIYFILHSTNIVEDKMAEKNVEEKREIFQKSET